AQDQPRHDDKVRDRTRELFLNETGGEDRRVGHQYSVFITRQLAQQFVLSPELPSSPSGAEEGAFDWMPDVGVADQFVGFLVGNQSAEPEAMPGSRSLIMLVRHERDSMSTGAERDAQTHERENVAVSTNRYEDSMHRSDQPPHTT